MDEVLELVELAARRNTPALNLSGGMRRRLSLACALVHRPSVLFLDEPTVGIDPALRVQFWAYFRQLAADGATLVVSSHVMDEADRCDELLLMLHGKLLGGDLAPRSASMPARQDIEEAFLKLGVARKRRRTAEANMNIRRTLAISRRIAEFFRRDERSAGARVRGAHRDHGTARLGHPRPGTADDDDGGGNAGWAAGRRRAPADPRRRNTAPA